MSDLLDFSLPGSSVHGILQVRILEWVAILQEIFLTQESNPSLLLGGWMAENVVKTKQDPLGRKYFDWRGRSEQQGSWQCPDSLLARLS